MKKKANSYTLFFVITLLLAWAAGLILFAVSTTRMTPVLTDERTDAIIVLTGGSRRINTGLQLFAEGKSDQLFISGVNSGVSLNDIENMHKGSELPECCISIGYQANNTMNNAAESRLWLQSGNFHTIRLVTSNYHLNRALLEFHHSMPDLKILVHPVKEYDDWSQGFWKKVTIEYNKTLVTWLRQRFEALDILNGN